MIWFYYENYERKSNIIKISIKLINLYTKGLNKWNRFKVKYKNNLLILNSFFIGVQLRWVDSTQLDPNPMFEQVWAKIFITWAWIKFF